MNVLDYIVFFWEFLQNEHLNGVYIALIAYLVFGSLFAILGRRRYMHV